MDRHPHRVAARQALQTQVTHPDTAVNQIMRTHQIR